MEQNNSGSQDGDNSLNVGIGDFRGAHVNIGSNGRPVFTPEEMQIIRHPSLGGRSVKGENVSAFGIVTGIGSLIGLYFTLFQAFPSGKSSSWASLFVFFFGIAIISIALSAVLRRRKFERFLFGKYYLERGSKGGIHLSRFTASCPWCGSKMFLRMVGPKDGPREDHFICERNSQQHTIELDPTILTEIKE
jgi:hypothetical protein